MPADQSAPRKAPIGAFLLLVLACLLYLPLIASIADTHHSDAAGRGLAAAFAAIFGAVLWLVLIALVLIGAINGKMPRWALIAAVILVPLSGIAALAAMSLDVSHARWANLPPMLLPPLIAFYALWARIPALHRLLPEPATSAAVWGAVFVLTAVPLSVAYMDSRPDSTLNVRQEAEYKARMEQFARESAEAERRETAKFAQLNPDSSLRDYLDYLAPGASRFRAAVEGVRRVKSRDSDAVTLLNEGKIYPLQELWRLDVKPASALCNAYRGALVREAAKINKSRSDYLSVAIDIERLLPNIKWLVAERCNLDEALIVLEQNIKAVSDSSRTDQLAATLAAFRQPR